MVGYDSFTGRFDRKAETLRLHAAFSLRGGILLAQVHTIGQVPKFRGTITGGTGVYEGATGTVRGHGGQGRSHLLDHHLEQARRMTSRDRCPRTCEPAADG